jgi:adenylyltransferase/sulfurtransferase
VYTLELPKHERGTGPGSAEEFLSFGYTLWCDGVIADEETAVLVEEGWTIVDVRELDEHPRLTLSHIPVPLGQLETHLDSLRDRNIIFICQSGKRSLRAVKLARELGINALSYKGGINRYIQQTETI